MKLEGMKMNFLGDSITQGIGTTAQTRVFHQLIKEECGMEFAYNYGLSGTRIARQVVPTKNGTQMDLTFELRAEIMDRDVDAVVVLGGTNDFGHGDAPFGDYDSTDIFTFCGAVNSLVDRLKKDYEGKRIVFMTPLHRLNENVPDAPCGKILSDYADAINEICKRKNVDVIDLFAINPIDPEDKELIPDGLHPSDKGHAVMAKVIAEELKKL